MIKVLNYLDFFAVLSIILFQLDILRNLLLFAALYLIIKGLIFFPDMFSIVDGIAGVFFLLAFIGMLSYFTWMLFTLFLVKLMYSLFL